MTDFNELQSTNEYLVDQLIMARKTNDLMEENNRRLENMLIKAIKDLQDGSNLIDALRNSINDLTSLVTRKVGKI